MRYGMWMSQGRGLLPRALSFARNAPGLTAGGGPGPVAARIMGRADTAASVPLSGLLVRHRPTRPRSAGASEYWLPPSFSTGWRRFSTKAGLLDVPLLGLRHGSATLMLAAGVADVVAAQIMGHADTRILRRYQDVVPDLTRDAAARMSSILAE